MDITLTIQLSSEGVYYAVCGSKVEQAGFVECGITSGELRTVLLGIGVGFKRAAIVLDTKLMTLVPDGLFSAEAAHGYLQINKIAANDMTPIAAPSVNNVCAAMLCPNPVKAVVESIFEKVTYLSPIQANIAQLCKKTIHVNLSDFAYITLSDNGLKYAEALEYADDADVVYYVGDVMSRFQIKKPDIIVSGRNSKRVAALLGKYYNRVGHERVGLRYRSGVEYRQDESYNVITLSHAHS